MLLSRRYSLQFSKIFPTGTNEPTQEMNEKKPPEPLSEVGVLFNDLRPPVHLFSSVVMSYSLWCTCSVL